MKLYHSTSRESADAIDRDGFRDARGSYGLVGLTLTGVFVSDQPLDENEGASSGVRHAAAAAVTEPPRINSNLENK